MKHSIAVLLLLVILTFVGCESTDVITLPHQEPRLVVNSVGMSGYRWAARVGASQDVLDINMFKGLNNATVKIYENDVLFEELETVDTLYEPSSEGARYYGSDTKMPQPGNRYKIVAECPGYKTIESEYLQPDSVPVTSFDIKVLGPSTNGYPGAKDLAITIGFDDPRGENYYEITLLSRAEPAPNYVVSGQHYLLFVDPAYKENNEIFYDTKALDDKYFDGKSVKLEFSSVDYPNTTGFPGPIEYTYSAVVRNVTKDYFLYLKTTSLQRKTYSDPLAQPVLLSNNIINGYGIFGGYSQTKKNSILVVD